MATIRDVATRAGVSVASASRALNGHANVAPATRDRIVEAARALHYVPHEGARSLTRRRSDAIGVVLPDLFGAIAIRTMRGRVDGLLVMPPEGDASYLQGAVPAGLPAVLLNHDRCEGGRAGAVGVDHYGGARAMTAHLVAQGYRRIAHIAGPHHNRDARERQRGFVDGLSAATGERSPIIIPGDYSERGGAEAARLLIAGQLKVDAIFCANDMMAIGALTLLADAGIAVPDRIAVAGFDDIPLAHYAVPPLTTMKVCIAEMGSRAMTQLLDQMQGDSPAGAQ